MVSFQAPVLSNCVNKVPEHVEIHLDQSLSNKRKTMDHHNFAEEQEISFIKKSKPVLSLHSTGLDSGIEPQLERRLSLDWQQCLDIQSGKVHFYNARTKTSTSRDPRGGSGSLDLPRSRSRSPCHMRLDLELNLPCDDDSSDPKVKKLHTDLHSKSEEESYGDLLLNNFGIHNEKTKKIDNISSKNSSTVSAPSWLAFGGDEKSEMVATVCKRCFMLVMLCKASPACPNCKFMHSLDQSAPHLFKRNLSKLLY